jgi:predicted GIY-YIG superfamily endonuclease
MLYFILQTMSHFVYIMASKKNGTLYIGSTTNLVKRIHEHKEKLVEGFTKKYNITVLVYVELYKYMGTDVHRYDNTICLSSRYTTGSMYSVAKERIRRCSREDYFCIEISIASTALRLWLTIYFSLVVSSS